MRTDPPLFTRPFVLLLAAQAIFGFGFSTFLILPTYLTKALAASPSQIGLVTAIFGISSMIFMPLVGDWADRTRRLPWAMAGAGICAVASLGFVWVHDIGPLVYVLRLLHGFGNALEFVAAGALTIDLVPKKRLGQGLGFFGVSILSTNAVAPATAEAIAARWGWGPAFSIAAIASTIGLLLLSRVKEPEREPSHAKVRSIFHVAFTRRSLWSSGFVALIGVGFASLFTFIQPYALDLGASRVGSFFLGYTATAVGVRVVFGGLSDRLGRARVGLAMMMLYSVPIALSADLQLSWLPWIGAIFGLAHGLLFPTLNALVVEPVPPNERAKVLALFMAAFNAGWSLGSVALGLIAEAVGYPAVFWAATAAVWAAALLFIASAEARRAIGRAPSQPSAALG